MSENKKIKKKMGKLEIGFTIFSLIFLIGFSCFYAYRMFYYKNKLLPKSSDGSAVLLLSNKIKENVVSTGDGLYNLDNNFVFRGENVNNYIRYSNMLFRIIKINKDNTIDMILDDGLNYLSYDSEKINYKDSNINKYLNDIFYNNIKSDLLIKSPYCTDKITDVNKITCNNLGIDYVKLLSLSDYLNSKNNDSSYLNNNGIIWLNNSNEDSVWLLNENNLSYSKPNELYLVKPIITLHNLVAFNSGDGSIDNPYTLDENKSYYASYVKLDNDLYRVYGVFDNVLKLQSNEIYKNGNTKYQLSSKSNLYSIDDGLGKYLNTNIFNTLSYKDLLLECETYVGEYNSSYENIKQNVVNGKIGINSIIDPIFNFEKINYYLSTPYEKNNVYIYNDGVYSVSPNIIRNISMSVCIDKNKIISGDGSIDSPYVLNSEV